MSLRNDIMRFSVLGFRSDIKIELQAPVVQHLTQETTWESDKNTRKRYTKERQDVSPFPAALGDHSAAMKTNTAQQTLNIKKTKRFRKRNTAL